MRCLYQRAQHQGCDEMPSGDQQSARKHDGAAAITSHSFRMIAGWVFLNMTALTVASTILYGCLVLPIGNLLPTSATSFVTRERSSIDSRTTQLVEIVPFRQLQVSSTTKQPKVPHTTAAPAADRTRLLIQKVHKMASEEMVAIFKALGKSIELPRETVSEGLTFKYYLRKHPGGRSFIISSIRNPCSWYVSYWKYESMQATPIPRDLLASKTEGWTSNVTRFRKYMLSKQGRGPPFMSWVVLKNIVDQHDDRPKQPCDILGAKPGACIKQDEFGTRFEGYTVDNGAVNCFVWVENLYEDVKTCLRKYEAWAGITLNWTLANTYLDKRSGALHKSNSVSGLPCAEYYDREVEDLVKFKDRGIFNAYGYAGCCVGPTRPNVTIAGGR